MSEREKLTQADDNFCEALYQDYMNSLDKNESYSLEDCKKEWGLIIYHLRVDENRYIINIDTKTYKW